MRLFDRRRFRGRGRYRKGRRIRARALLRALFPKRIVMSRSTVADLGYFYFNLFLFGIIFGWALLSFEVLSHSVADLLTAIFGPRQPTSLSPLVTRTVMTVTLFLAYGSVIGSTIISPIGYRSSGNSIKFITRRRCSRR